MQLIRPCVDPCFFPLAYESAAIFFNIVWRFQDDHFLSRVRKIFRALPSYERMAPIYRILRGNRQFSIHPPTEG